MSVVRKPLPLGPRNKVANSDFVQIASFGNAAEAEQLRSVLEDHEVPAFVDGANANTALSHVGSALGGVRVLVSVSDAQRAAEIIESLVEEDDTSGGPWFCGRCKKEVDGDFQVCWSCGEPRTPRTDVEQPFPQVVEDGILLHVLKRLATRRARSAMPTTEGGA